jgi:hypothetical protein
MVSRFVAGIFGGYFCVVITFGVFHNGSQSTSQWFTKWFTMVHNWFTMVHNWFTVVHKVDIQCAKCKNI